MIGQREDSRSTHARCAATGHAQGSVRTLTNQAGATTDTYAYTAFGALRARQGTSANPYQYTGQPWDAASNLYTLRARMYDPATGRFLSADPWALDVTNPVERNRYAYVANNPINASDPSGYVATPSYGVNLQPAVRATPAIAALGLVTAKTLLTVSIGALLGYGVARSTDLPDVDVGDVAIDDDLIAISPIFLGCDRGATTSQIRRAAIPDSGSYA